MRDRQLWVAFFGRSRRGTWAALALAFGLLVATHWTLAGAGTTGESLDRWLSQGYNLLFFMSVLFVLAGANAVANDGVLASVAFAVGPLVGYFLAGNMGFPRDPTFLQYWGAAVQGGLFYGVPIGVGGYVLGRAVRRRYDRGTGSIDSGDTE